MVLIILNAEMTACAAEKAPTSMRIPGTRAGNRLTAVMIPVMADTMGTIVGIRPAMDSPRLLTPAWNSELLAISDSLSSTGCAFINAVFLNDVHTWLNVMGILLNDAFV